MHTRAQGRPCRGESQVGRNGIVEGIRNVLRSGRCSDISRKNLALHIGVTPALITYYFPKRESLMEEVVFPIIQDYRIRLGRIVERETAPEDRLREIIGLLADLYGKDAKILSIYRSLEESAPTDARELTTMTSILSDFFYEWRGDQRTRSFDAAVLQGAVRGMCEFAERARGEMSSAVSTSEPGQADELDWLEPLHRMLIAGRKLFNPSQGSEMMAIAS